MKKIITEIKELKKLLDEGSINEEEFDILKKKIIYDDNSEIHKSFEIKNNKNPYKNLIMTLKKLFDDSLDEGDADQDELIGEIDEIIKEKIVDVDKLKDYILIHDPWNERDGLIRAINRRSALLYHKKYDKMIRKIIDSKHGWTYDQLAIDFLEENLRFDLKKAKEKELIIDLGFHTANYGEAYFNKIYTNEFNMDMNALSFVEKQSKLSSLSEKIYFLRDDYGKELRDIDNYKVLLIDEPCCYDAYIFIPLDKKILKDELERKVSLVRDKHSQVTLGAWYDNKFYPRFNVWMSFSHDLPFHLNSQSVKEYLEEKFIYAYDSSDFEKYFK